MQLSVAMKRRQQGIGLIEVLIAVLVLSFGMLGMVGLQTWSLRNNQSALERGMATVQTHSIVDAMRADRVNAANGSYDIALDDDTPDGNSYRDEAIRNWREDLVVALNPTATGSIDCDGAFCTIVVQWNDERAGGEATQQIVTEVQL
jgi:type IV pilus assembly protein PilV